MQASPIEPAIPAIQALRQRALQLVEEQRSLRQSHEERNHDQQALTTQLLELSSQRDGLQQERDRLLAERDSLATSQEEISSQRDALQAERDAFASQFQEYIKQSEELKHALDHLTQEKQQLEAALGHVFPHETYKEKRPDLTGLDDKRLIEHFIAHGINEKTDLSHASIKQAFEQRNDEIRRLKKETTLINAELSAAQIRMELLKDLISGTTIRQNPEGHKDPS